MVLTVRELVFLGVAVVLLSVQFSSLSAVRFQALSVLPLLHAPSLLPPLLVPTNTTSPLVALGDKVYLCDWNNGLRALNKVDMPSQIVAMALLPPSAIVVVTDKLQVLVFDITATRLQGRWRVNLGPVDVSVGEVVASASELGVWNGDHGSVFVAVLAPPHEGHAQWRHRTAPDDEEEDSLHIRNTHCLDGQTGALRWTQGPEEDQAPEHSDESWRLHVATASSGHGQSWAHFQPSFARHALPHVWHSPANSHAMLVPLARAHHKERHDTALVTHSAQGVQVRHLFTGRALTAVSVRPHTLVAAVHGVPKLFWLHEGKLFVAPLGTAAARPIHVCSTARACSDDAPLHFDATHSLALVLFRDGELVAVHVGHGVSLRIEWRLRTHAAWDNAEITGKITATRIHPDAVLVQGKRINLIDVATGSILATLSGQKTVAVLEADLDGDRQPDLAVLRSDGLLTAYSLAGGTSVGLMPLIIALIAIASLLIAAKKGKSWVMHAGVRDKDE